MVPRGPKTPKMYIKTIGFSRGGASGPRGCERLENCGFFQNIFAFSVENVKFNIKTWNFMKFHHFSPSQNLAQTNGFLVIFQRVTAGFQRVTPMLQKGWNSTPFSVSGPQKCSLGPRMGPSGPPRKILYKHKVLGAFLEAQNRKSAFLAQKDGNSAPKPEFHQKPPELLFSRQGGEPHETLPFLL